MRYYIQNATGEKFYFAHLVEGEVPTSNQGLILDSIKEVLNTHYTGICVVIAGYNRKPHKVFTVF